jgi:hypothetical protein
VRGAGPGGHEVLGLDLLEPDVLVGVLVPDVHVPLPLESVHRLPGLKLLATGLSSGLSLGGDRRG